MPPPRPLVLLTDFGLRDSYVASMKGVILGLLPRATLVDLSHEVEPQNLFQAAFLLEATYPYFPKGSVFVTVVDPGVGSERQILAARAPHGIFLAPDNGILAGVLEREKRFELRAVTNRKFFRESISHTFHGRDCFAPTAARLARNPALFSKLGPRRTRYHKLNIPLPRSSRTGVRGEVLFFDRFGNAFTNIRSSHLKLSGPGRGTVKAGTFPLGSLRQAYYQVPRGRALALVSSTGQLEIAVNQGSAREALGLKKGTPIEVLF